MKRDIAFDTVPEIALIPTDITANGATAGATIDRLGFQNAVLAFLTGVVDGAISFALKIQHGDASNASDMADFDNGGWTVAAATTDNSIWSASFDLSGAKRYIRIHVTTSGVSSDNAVVSAFALLGAKKTPVVAADFTNHAGFFQPYDNAA